MNRYTVDSCALLLRPGSTKGMSKAEVCDELNELTAKVEALEAFAESVGDAYVCATNYEYIMAELAEHIQKLSKARMEPPTNE